MKYFAKEGTKHPKVKDHYEAKLIERDAKIKILQRANKLLVEKEKTDSKLIKKLTEVVEDFLPNTGNCALQDCCSWPLGNCALQDYDYGRLNDAMIESKERLTK